MSYSVYSKFDLEQHKKTFVNYLEVIILKDGTIEYAVPSHQEYLIKLACQQKEIDREELYRQCPPEYYGDFTKWLCMQTGAVSVWDRFIIYDKFTMAQVHVLDALAIAGVYKGPLLG